MTIQIKVTVQTGQGGTIPIDTVQRYMHKEDWQIDNSSWGGGIRPCAPCPAVWVMKDDPHVHLNQQWQYYIIAINYNMSLSNTYLLLDNHLAFANNTGFGTLDNPERIDYFFNRLNYEKFPQLDKVRTTSRSVVTGVEQYGIATALNSARNALQARSRSLSRVKEALVSLNQLKIKTFDSTNPPPLKAGRTYPTRISDINPDDYLYLPQYSREMFLVANLVNRSGDVVQFPRGALYSWTGDQTTYSFLPHISNWSYGPVIDSLSNYIKLPIGSPVPRPYRSS